MLIARFSGVNGLFPSSGVALSLFVGSLPEVRSSEGVISNYAARDWLLAFSAPARVVVRGKKLHTTEMVKREHICSTNNRNKI